MSSAAASSGVAAAASAALAERVDWLCHTAQVALDASANEIALFRKFYGKELVSFLSAPVGTSVVLFNASAATAASAFSHEAKTQQQLFSQQRFSQREVKEKEQSDNARGAATAEEVCSPILLCIPVFVSVAVFSICDLKCFPYVELSSARAEGQVSIANPNGFESVTRVSQGVEPKVVLFHQISRGVARRRLGPLPRPSRPSAPSAPAAAVKRSGGARHVGSQPDGAVV